MLSRDSYPVRSRRRRAQSAVAKFVPKAPGADRELLFVGLEGVRNVVPIIDSAEYQDNWVMVMHRADRSLRDHLTRPGLRSCAGRALPLQAGDQGLSWVQDDYA